MENILYQKFLDACSSIFSYLTKNKEYQKMNHEELLRYKEIFNLEKCVEFHNAFGKDNEIVKRKFDLIGIHNNMRIFPNDRTLIRAFLAQIKRHSFSKKKKNMIIKNIWNDFNKIMYNEYISIKEIILLLNFNSELEISLDKNIRIRKCTAQEKQNMREYLSNSDKTINYLRTIDNCKFVLEIIQDFPIVRLSQERQLREGINHSSYPKPKKSSESIIEDFIYAMRIYKIGLLRLSDIFYQDNLSSNLLFPLTLRRMDNEFCVGINSNVIGKIYSLNKNEKRKFIEIWRFICKKNFKKVKLFELALNRFVYADVRKNIDDIIIDYAISLETLFSYGAADSITHKISVRCARLVYKDNKNRKNLANEIKFFYKIRSAIVHGSFGDKKVQKIRDNSGELNNLVRKIDETIRIANQKIIKFISKIDEIRNINSMYEELKNHLDYGNGEFRVKYDNLIK